jgi:hypothetical protein
MVIGIPTKQASVGFTDVLSKFDEFCPSLSFFYGY